MKEVINGKESTIIPIRSERKITFIPGANSKGNGDFHFIHPETGKVIPVSDPIIYLLHDSIQKRESVLRKNKDWFDCPPESLNKIIAEIVSIKDPIQRIEKTEKWRKASTILYYRDIHRTLREREEITIDKLLPPNAEGLLRHYRITSEVEKGGDFLNAIEHAAVNFMREEKLLIVIDRYIAFPIPIPMKVINAIKNLSKKKRNKLINDLIRSPHSPLSKFHLIYLLLQCNHDINVAKRFLLDILSDEGQKEFDAFWAVLDWVNSEFNRWTEVKKWPEHIRFAMVWAHTHRLYILFKSGGVTDDSIIRSFHIYSSAIISSETFARKQDYWFDVAHPRNINYISLIIDGINYITDNNKSLISQDLKEIINSRISKDDETKLPDLSLLKDSSRLSNFLNSFLGFSRDRILSKFIDFKDAQLLSYEGLKELVKSALNKLENQNDNIKSWFLLHAIIGDSSIYNNLVDQVKIILYRINYLDLFKKDTSLGIYSIGFACQQLHNLNNEELKLKIKDQLYQIAEYFSTLDFSQLENDTNIPEEFSKPDKICYKLIEMAYNISITNDSPEEAIIEFIDILRKLIDTWKVFIPETKNIIQRLCEELPITQSQHLWKLLVRLRAE